MSNEPKFREYDIDGVTVWDENDEKDLDASFALVAQANLAPKLYEALKTAESLMADTLYSIAHSCTDDMKAANASVRDNPKLKAIRAVLKLAQRS